MKRNTGLNTIFTLLVSGLSLACSTTAPQPLTIIAASEPSPSYAQPQMEPEPTPQLPPEPELKKVKIVVTPKIERSIPRGSRIILTDFDGRCATEVRDALMRRLVDNTDYNVVTRDFLSQIVSESTKAYTGNFNTDTATKLGDLLAASTFVVGRVAYCGTPRGQELAQEADSEQYIIQAILQILDIRTGKVLVSSTAEGSYVPESAQLMKLVGEATHQLEPTIPDAKDAEAPDNDQEPSKDASDETPIHYPAYKAAEDLANSFADKFFARSTWEDKFTEYYDILFYRDS